MCNEYGNRIPYSRYVEEFSHLKLPLTFATATPNLEPRDSIKLTDTALIIRPQNGGARLDVVRWSAGPIHGPSGRCSTCARRAASSPGVASSWHRAVPKTGTPPPSRGRVFREML